MTVSYIQLDVLSNIMRIHLYEFMFYLLIACVYVPHDVVVV